MGWCGCGVGGVGGWRVNGRVLVVEWRRVEGIVSLVEAVLIGWAGGGVVM